jgi:hypothetical protein
MLFTFPADARWNDERQAVEFGIAIGEYEGVVRVPRRVFQHLLAESPTPERCSKPITSSVRALNRSRSASCTGAS